MAISYVNDQFDFKDAPHDHRAAFSRAPRRIELLPGDMIARFVTPRQTTEIGCWWVSMNTLERMLARSQGTKRSLAKTVRLDLAIRVDWSSTLSQMLAYRLSSPVYAWTGLASKQPIATGDLTYQLPGGLPQLYIPNLESKHLVRLGGALTHFQSTAGHA